MSRKERPFSADQLPELLAQLPGGTNYRIAFSGGADSTALLQAMSEIAASLKLTVSALHVNHGLHPHSGEWQSRCERFCKERGIPLECRQVFPVRSGGINLEAEARRMRYGEAEILLKPGEVLLTGHHLEDQAETLLLNLLRGSGVDGLAGMPAARRLGRGWLARPLLRQSRASLQAFLRNRGIDWIEDPSNLDPGSDRNHIRHTVMPALDDRWPGASTRLARSTRHCREIADLMIDEANRLLPAFLDADGCCASGCAVTMPLPCRIGVFGNYCSNCTLTARGTPSGLHGRAGNYAAIEIVSGCWVPVSTSPAVLLTGVSPVTSTWVRQSANWSLPACTTPGRMACRCSQGPGGKPSSLADIHSTRRSNTCSRNWLYHPG
jgi:tRNA(Ile)-lysidine synthetase-like protein